MTLPVQQNTVIHRLHAVDGDFGSPRNLSFIADPRNDWMTFFRIDPLTGDVVMLRDGKELVERSCGTPVAILKVTVSFVRSCPRDTIRSHRADIVVDEEKLQDEKRLNRRR